MSKACRLTNSIQRFISRFWRIQKPLFHICVMWQVYYYPVSPEEKSINTYFFPVNPCAFSVLLTRISQGTQQSSRIVPPLPLSGNISCAFYTLTFKTQIKRERTKGKGDYRKLARLAIVSPALPISQAAILQLYATCRFVCLALCAAQASRPDGRMGI